MVQSDFRTFWPSLEATHPALGDLDELRIALLGLLLHPSQSIINQHRVDLISYSLPPSQTPNQAG